jgi:GNAT superfamily N-acetyltransferase
MLITRVGKSEHSEFLSLVNAEIRPDRAKTNAWDDFPLILGLENRDNQLICRGQDGRLAGGIACLISEFQTSCGIVSIAGIGSVVTHPDFRGKGLSAALQNEMLHQLRGKNVPLAVLWTDQPEIYSGRGFEQAGWEIHADLTDLGAAPVAVDVPRTRSFQPDDSPRVEELYNRHPLRTVRRPGDSHKLYTMPGTRGLVAVDGGGQVQAAVFCGKGADFPGYITEWDGPWDLVWPLMAEAKNRGLADKALIPAGEEGLVNLLVDNGASWFAMPSGCWKVLDGEALVGLVARTGEPVPDDGQDPRAWLGCLDDQGQPLVGPLSVAIWGFDSV